MQKESGHQIGNRRHGTISKHIETSPLMESLHHPFGETDHLVALPLKDAFQNADVIP